MISKKGPKEVGAQFELAVRATSSGEWLAVEELRSVAVDAIAKGGGVTVSLEGVDHLEASVFQILLALASEQKKSGRSLRLINASAGLRSWFEYAGADQRFSFAQTGCEDA